MNFIVKNIKKNKLSFKILSGAVHKNMPPIIHKTIITIRYLFFKRFCFKNNPSVFKYSDGSWVNRETTKDLLRIQSYLSSESASIKVMQAGIGNSSLFRAVIDRIDKLVGITIVPEEIEYAKTNFPNDFGKKYEIWFTNKYSANLEWLGKDFDFIVDNDISSYACCKQHFRDMLTAYRMLLAPNGKIMIGKNGLGYFDNGFGLTETLAKKIFMDAGFTFTKTKFGYQLKII